MVTRTVVVTNVEVMCVNVTTAEVQVLTKELTGSYSDTAVALKALKKVYETETFKCVAIQQMTEQEVIYGMKEVDFIRLAKPMDENRKFIDENGEEIEEDTEA